MKLLLHLCCAPCALPIIERLKDEPDLEISLYFFNPNIYPDEEHEKRLDMAKKVAKIYDLALFVENVGFEKWNQEISSVLSSSPETYPENSDRCDACLAYRLNKVAEFAHENNFDAFATTLSVSLWKNTRLLKKSGRELAKKYKLEFRELEEIDPQLAYNEEKELAKKHEIYCQKYCGCRYSLTRTNMD